MTAPDKDIQILSVDDFVTMRRIVKNILRQLGYANIDEAENGVSALEALRTKRYDLVISDWNMPAMSGIELLRDVRSDPTLRRTPFLMVTGVSDHSRAVELEGAGASAILKPFTPEALEEKLAEMF